MCRAIVRQRLLLSALLLSSVKGWLPSGSTSKMHHTARSVTTATLLPKAPPPRASVDDNIDEWYADFDAAQYESRETRWSAPSSFDDRGDRPSFRQKRRGSRSAGGGVGYTRDTSHDNSNVDEAAVERLIEARQQARQRRDYDAADTLRDELLQVFGVAVSDRDATWRTGCSESGSGMRRGSGYRMPAPRSRGDGGGVHRRGTEGDGARRRPEWNRYSEFPNGHDYELSRDSGPNISDLMDDEIHAILADRLTAKLCRDFAEADRLQQLLLHAGVFVHDARREWRADGASFRDLRDGADGRRGGRSPSKGPYVRSDYSQEVNFAEAQAITQLVARRDRVKFLRRFEEADEICNQLQQEYNVVVDDRLREWSKGGDFGEEANRVRQMSEAIRQRGYVQSASSRGRLGPAEEATVAQLVEARTQAKRDKRYDEADAIRDRLLSDYDVYLLDKKKLWSVGGDFRSEGGGVRNELLYTRIGGAGELTEDNVTAIEAVLRSRAEARNMEQYADADLMSDTLFSKYLVRVDDRSRSWWVHSEDGYLQEPMVASVSSQQGLTPEELHLIQAKLRERLRLKTTGEYEASDAIRDELRDLYDVRVNDKTRSWRFIEVGEGDKADDGNEHARGDYMPPRLNGPVAAAPSMLDEHDASGTDDDTDVANCLAEPELVPEALAGLTVPELKERLRRVGRPVSGKKAELIERLLA